MRKHPWQAHDTRLEAPLLRRRANNRCERPFMRRGGRVVECAALEMRFTGNRNVGSNPTLSANHSFATIRRPSEQPISRSVAVVKFDADIRLRSPTAALHTWSIGGQGIGLWAN